MVFLEMPITFLIESKSDWVIDLTVRTGMTSCVRNIFHRLMN